MHADKTPVFDRRLSVFIGGLPSVVACLIW